MKVPRQTSEIFEVLSKGQFICSNSTDDRIRRLYEIIDVNETYDNLYNYFLAINFILEKGDEFYYFSRIESKAELERKLETAFRWIDIVDLFKTFDSSFSSGYSFSASEILVKLQVDAVLKNKLDGLKKWTKEDNYVDSISRLIKMLCDDGFAELENEILKTFKVLSSFKYLEELINNIHIPEEHLYEIPE
jgi:hypothetical protein